MRPWWFTPQSLNTTLHWLPHKRSRFGFVRCYGVHDVDMPPRPVRCLLKPLGMSDQNKDAWSGAEGRDVPSKTWSNCSVHLAVDTCWPVDRRCNASWMRSAFSWRRTLFMESQRPRFAIYSRVRSLKSLSWLGPPCESRGPNCSFEVPSRRWVQTRPGFCQRRRRGRLVVAGPHPPMDVARTPEGSARLRRAVPS